MYCSLANTVMLVWFVNYINKARAGEYIEKEMFEAVPENVFNCVIDARKGQHSSIIRR